MYKIFLMNFLLAISTTVGMTIIPFLVTDSLGLSLLILGILEGTTEFLSNVLRLTNGVLFDKIKNKRNIFVFATGLAFVAKASLLLPTSWVILFSKTAERVANGAFAAPRDAFVAESNQNKKGMALGLLTVSKTAGCVLGPLLVSASTLFLGTLKDNLYTLVICCCVLVFPVFLMSFTLNAKAIKTTEFSIREFQSVFKKISPILFLALLFFLGRFNDGLLMMYLKQNGFPEWFYLSTIAIFNFIMLISSPFMGLHIDRGNLKKVLYITIGALCTFNICFFHINSVNWVLAIIGIVAWGVQRTGAQIVFSSLVFQGVEKENYGTAIGLFYIVSGFGTMIASFFCGYMAQNTFSLVFAFSGFFAFLSLGISFNLLKRNSAPLEIQGAAQTSV
jgi:MFS-type transporter involved in bile tolerance (Atg22 family)